MADWSEYNRLQAQAEAQPNYPANPSSSNAPSNKPTELTYINGQWVSKTVVQNDPERYGAWRDYTYVSGSQAQGGQAGFLTAVAEQARQQGADEKAAFAATQQAKAQEQFIKTASTKQQELS